jgi:hypothetical protein
MLGLSSCLVRRVGGIAATVAAVALIAAPAALAATTVAAGAGVPFSGIVDSTPSCAPATATITWGDNTATSPGTYDSMNLDVTGKHTYTAPGVYNGSVALTGGNCAANTADPFTATVARFTECPPVGNDGGCQFLLVVAPGGTTLSTDANLANTPYDAGGDDALIGVQNNSPGPIASIPLATPNQPGLFGFEADGLCDPGLLPIPTGCTPIGQPVGTACTITDVCAFPAPPGQPAGYTEPGNLTGSTQNGYEGPQNYFTNVSVDQSSGVVDFSPPLQPGKSTYFSLEEPPVGTSIAAGSMPQGVSLSAPPTVTTNGASFAGTVNPNGSSTTVYFQYGLDSEYYTPGTHGPVYTNTTPPQMIGGDFSAHPVFGSAANLVPNALYHVRLVAMNSSGTTFGPDTTFMTKADPPPKAPVLGKSVDIVLLGGLVYIRLPGGHPAADVASASTSPLVKGKGFVPLTEARQIPVGSQIDAIQGTISLSAASTVTHGKIQKGVFSGAIFSVAQGRSGLTKGQTTLSLLEGDFPGAPTFSACPKAAADTGSVFGPIATVASSKILQSLHARDNHGNFRTRGRYASGTVRGTVWTTADRCDGTLTTVQRGTVIVTDFRLRKTITLHGGQSYLARAPIHKK